MTVKDSALGTEKTRRRLYYGWIVVGVSFITILIVYTARYNFSLFYTAILQEFHWSRASTAGIFSAGLIIYAIGAPVIGRLVDSFGIRRVVPAGAVLFGLALIGCSQIHNRWQLYFMYCVVALGTCAAGYVAHMAILPNWFVKRRGLAIGIMTSALMVSSAFAPAIGYLISTIGWRGAFFVLAIITIVFIAPLAAIFQRQKPADKGLEPDGVSSQFKYEKIKSVDKSDTSLNLIVNSNWASTEWTLVRAISTPRFWMVLLMAFSFGVWGYSILVHQVAYLVEAGYSNMFAAGITGIFGIFATLGSLCGFISDRFGREVTYGSGSVIALLGIAVLNLIQGTQHIYMPYAYAILIGLSYGLLSPVSSTVYADLFQGRHFGSINGFITACFVAGGALGPWFVGYLFDINGNYYSIFPLFYLSIAASAIFCWLAAPRKVRLVPGRILTK